MTCNIQSDLVFCKSSSCVEAFSSQPAPNIIEKNNLGFWFFRWFLQNYDSRERFEQEKVFHCFHLCHLPRHLFPVQAGSFATKKVGGGRKSPAATQWRKSFGEGPRNQLWLLLWPSKWLIAIATFTVTLKMIVKCQEELASLPEVLRIDNWPEGLRLGWQSGSRRFDQDWLFIV